MYSTNLTSRDRHETGEGNAICWESSRGKTLSWYGFVLPWENSAARRLSRPCDHLYAVAVCVPAMGKLMKLHLVPRAPPESNCQDSPYDFNSLWTIKETLHRFLKGIWAGMLVAYALFRTCHPASVSQRRMTALSRLVSMPVREEIEMLGFVALLHYL